MRVLIVAYSSKYARCGREIKLMMRVPGLSFDIKSTLLVTISSGKHTQARYKMSASDQSYLSKSPLTTSIGEYFSDDLSQFIAKLEAID